MKPQTDIAITQLIKRGGFTLSAEIIPPRNGVGPDAIYEQIEKLKSAGAQFLSVTRGAGGSLRGGSLPIAQMIKENFRMPCIAHFTCRDLLPEEVENQLVDHHFFGIRNILALRGDPPTGETGWTPRPGSHSYAYKLVEQIKALNAGHYLERQGFAVSEREKTQFCVGVACYPDHPSAYERIEHFRLKVEAGAEFAISQMLLDPDSYARFVETCDKAGLHIPVLPGLRMLKSQEQAGRMAARFGLEASGAWLKSLPQTDQAASPHATLESFMRLTEKLRAHGAPGLHLFVMSDLELAQAALSTLAPRVRELSA